MARPLTKAEVEALIISVPYGALLTYALEHEIYWLDLMLAAAF
jgi:hypothetical protein